MIHALIVFIVCILFYWNIVSFHQVFSNPYPNREKENLEDQIPTTTRPHYTFDVLQGGEIVTSDGEKWKFPIPHNYVLLDHTLTPIDECYGKENGFQLEAKGERLYNFLQRNEPQIMEGSTIPTHINRPIQSGRIFYFKCHNNQIAGVHACYPGHLFESNRCVPINPCLSNNTNQKVNVFPDPYNKHFYYECHDGNPEHKKCPENNIFFIDQCIQKSDHMFAICEGEKNGTLHPIDNQTYVKCYQNRPTFHVCPPGMNFFPSVQRCESNQCFGYPDGLQPSLPVKKGPFSYSEGYIECEGGRVKNRIQCPLFWDHYLSKGDNLTHLPSVFDGNKCSIPSLCENVQPDNADVIVPVHEFTKYTSDILSTSQLYDSTVGIRCENGRKRVVLEPGMHISPDYRIESACTGERRRVVIGDTVDRYYDCDTQTVLPCPKETFFNGTECQPNTPHAHYFKNVPIFKMDNLSPFNDWMMNTPTPTATHSKIPNDPEYEYLWKYDIWSHKDCTRFPFLSHVQFSFILPDGKGYCQFQNGQIKKIPLRNDFRLKYWSQRFVPYDVNNKDDECHPGMKLRSGIFVIDSLFYATCDPNQPFVFCPSSSTQSIEKTNGIWACKPHDRVYEGVLPAQTNQTVLMGLERFKPQPGAKYTLNGNEFVYRVEEQPNGIPVSSEICITLSSEQPIQLYFKKLPTYPPDIYLEGKQWMKRSNTEKYVLPFHKVVLQE